MSSSSVIIPSPCFSVHILIGEPPPIFWYCAWILGVLLLAIHAAILLWIIHWIEKWWVWTVKKQCTLIMKFTWNNKAFLELKLVLAKCDCWFALTQPLWSSHWQLGKCWFPILPSFIPFNYMEGTVQCSKLYILQFHLPLIWQKQLSRHY